MGALIVAEETVEGRQKESKESIVEKICASDPVVYQLVRVEGDGRLVPATDDELMEVEQLLEDDGSKLQLIEDKSDCAQIPSDEEFQSNISNLEGPEGPLKSENMEVDAQTSHARNEEEGSWLNSGAVRCSPEYIVTEGRSSDGSKLSQTVVNKGQYETIPEESLEPSNEEVSCRSSVSETHSSKPDFSVLKGEVCLDNLTIRELQEVFRATFGRQTTVKDKLWLKRRIAMGLTNSCNVPTSSFVIKDNMIVPDKVKEELRTAPRNMCRTDMVSSSTNDHQDCPKKVHNQIKVQNKLSGKRRGKPLLESDSNKDHEMEYFSVKRARKPTKRYIEELSEVDVVDSTGHDQPSPKSGICVARERGNLVTRKDSLGGSGIQIPYVSRVRRSRPRKSFLGLMNFGCTDNEGRNTKTSNSEEERDQEHGNMEINAGVNLDADADVLPSMETGSKRKHHRAWSLCEVLKLVEGVAKYGAGKWSEIRRVSFASNSYRTSVDLKDKWRNLLKASFAQEPSEKGAKNLRKPTAMPIPTPILLRVRELAEMHAPSGIEFRPTKFAGHERKIVQEKEPGFL